MSPGCIPSYGIRETTGYRNINQSIRTCNPKEKVVRFAERCSRQGLRGLSALLLPRAAAQTRNRVVFRTKQRSVPLRVQESPNCAVFVMD